MAMERIKTGYTGNYGRFHSACFGLTVTNLRLASTMSNYFASSGGNPYPVHFLFPLIPACTARPGLPLSPPETAFLESPYYRPQTASIGDRHHPTNFHSVTYPQTDDAAFEAGSDNDHKSFLRMRVIFKVEYPAELFRFRRVLDDILSSFDVF